MIDFKFIQTRDIWRRFPDNEYLHHKFNRFLKEIKKIKGRYFTDAQTFCDYLPYEINYNQDFFLILYQLKLIHEDVTVREVWVDKNIDIIESHKDIINIINNEIDINQFIRRRKLKSLKDGIKH